MFSPGFGRGPPSLGFDCTGLVASGSSELEAALPVHSVCSLRRSLALVRADDSLHLVSSLSAEHFGLWPYGLAIAALPLVSRPWTCLCWSHLLSLSSGWFCSWLYRASWLAQGCIPLLRLLPYFLRSEAEFLRVLCFEFRAKSSRWGHPSGSSLSQSSIGTKTLPPPSWCVVRVFAMGSPCRVGVCPRSRSERRLFGAPSLVVGV